MSEDSKPEWPKRISCYSPGNKQKQCITIGVHLGLKDTALQRFSHLLDQCKLTFDVFENGTARLIAVNDNLVLDKQLSDYYEGRVNAQRQD